MENKALMLLALLILMNPASADWVDPWIRKNVSSQRDLLYIDMPDSFHRLEPVTVTVYINDPVIKEQANAMEVNPDNSNFYSIGRQMIRDSSGNLRSFIPYSGESSVTVGFKDNQWITSDKEGYQKPNVYFSFYSIKKPSGAGYPDTSTPDSEYFGYQCSTYYTSYFCPGKEGCVVCSKALGIVWKEYWLLPAHAEATLPGAYSFTDSRGTDEELKKNPSYLSYSYIKEDYSIGQNDWTGRPITCDDSYSLGIDASYFGLAADMDYLKNWQLSYNKAGIASGRTTVKDTTGPGGLLTGKAIEVITKEDLSNQWDAFSVSYLLIAQMDPPESGTVKLSMSRVGCAAKGGGSAQIEKAIEGVRQFGASYRVIYEDSAPGSFKPMMWYDVLRRDVGNVISGRITDGHGNGLPYMTVSIEYERGVYEGRTDESGSYEIKIPTLDFDENNPKMGTLRLYLSYVRDAKNYFNVLDHTVGDKLVHVEKNFSLETEMDKTQDFDYGTTSFTDTGSSSILANLKHIGPIYYHLSEVTDFALTQLKADIDYKLPVDVVFASASGTAYSRDTSSINIKIDDSAYDSTDRPDNREYHEFCHHILFSQWNGSGLRGPGDANHDGYINTGTGDSYTEGFAEFCAMACSKYRGEKRPELYAGFGSMELNYKAWGHRGYDEELAVNGILWDLYDDGNDANDTVSVPLGRMWEIMKERRPNFYEYYKAFKAAYPEKADAIDKVFIDHGFFADSNPGNGIRDGFEPFRDANGDGAYSAGDFFVDYGVMNASSEMSYDAGEVIGKSTNYERVNRSSVVKLPGSYVKASDPKVKRYLVKVNIRDRSLGEGFEYESSASDGLVYIAPLPEGLDAEITVVPHPEEYTSGKPYVTTNKEFVEMFVSAPDNQGYFDSHDFEAKPTGVEEDIVLVSGERASDSSPNETEEEGGGSIPLWVFGGLGVLLAGGLFIIFLIFVALFVFKRKK